MISLLLQGIRIAAATRDALKRKREEEPEEINGLHSPDVPVAPITLSHEFVAPPDYRQSEEMDPAMYGEQTGKDLASLGT